IIYAAKACLYGIVPSGKILTAEANNDLVSLPPKKRESRGYKGPMSTGPWNKWIEEHEKTSTITND
ncbi:hypothetical protein, partial [Desulfuribacillus stibiiarsenatis]|uniref:hypothetical protein n=1 Tax=Desulfuribacillus stibiiarsenatis TaxID=1390249 RepID=UPI001C407947